MMKTKDAAWLAGYMDGDGSILLANSGKRSLRRPMLSICSTDIEILQHVILLVGGALIKQSRKTGNQRTAWSWRLRGTKRVASMLRAILSHMRCTAKITRAKIIVNEMPLVVPRTGKYTLAQAKARIAFERRFFAVGPNRGKRSSVDPRLLAFATRSGAYSGKGTYS